MQSLGLSKKILQNPQEFFQEPTAYVISAIALPSSSLDSVCQI
jgi:hypothetical protein